MTTATGKVTYRNKMEVPFEVSSEKMAQQIDPHLVIEHGSEADDSVSIRYDGVGKPVFMGEAKRIILKDGEIVIDIAHQGYPERF